MSEITTNKKVTLEQLNIEKLTKEICEGKKIDLNDVCTMSLINLKQITGLDNIYLKELVNAAIDVTFSNNGSISAKRYIRTLEEEKRIELANILKKHNVDDRTIRALNREGIMNIDELSSKTAYDISQLRGLGPRRIKEVIDTGLVKTVVEVKNHVDFENMLLPYGITRKTSDALYTYCGIHSIEELCNTPDETILKEAHSISEITLSRIRELFPYKCDEKCVKEENSAHDKPSIIEYKLESSNTPVERLFLPARIQGRLIKHGYDSAEKLSNCDLRKLAGDLNFSDKQACQLIEAVEDFNVNKELGFMFSTAILSKKCEKLENWLNFLNSKGYEKESYRSLTYSIGDYIVYIKRCVSYIGDSIDKYMYSVQRDKLESFEKELDSIRNIESTNKVIVELKDWVKLTKTFFGVVNKYCEDNFNTISLSTL